jgi:hypothetical protein
VYARVKNWAVMEISPLPRFEPKKPLKRSGASLACTGMYHFRIPADPEYLHLLGRAVYNFATHEWIVAWTLEKLKPGFINECNEAGMTAGTIARRFGEIIKESANTLSADHHQKLGQVQQKFARLAKVRNQLLHAHPGTAPGGAQQLFYSRGSHGQTEWPMQQVEQAAIDFENANIEANALFYQLWPNV